MTRTWRSWAQLAAGLLLVALAVWVVLGQAGEGGGGAPSTTATPSTTASGSPSSSSAQPSPDRTPSSGLDRVAESELPREGREMIVLVRRGGPYPDRRDGVTFENRERILPHQDRGYYAEYTVRTPGEGDRGARRLVAGDGGDLYYTADHYASFRQVETKR